MIEMQPMIGKDLDHITKVQMMAMVKENNVDVMTNTALREVKSDSFKVNRNNEDMDVEFDYGFVCLGMKAEAPILADLQEKFADTDVQIVNIGDSVRARRIIDGIEEGRNTTIITLERLNLI